MVNSHKCVSSNKRRKKNCRLLIRLSVLLLFFILRDVDINGGAHCSITRHSSPHRNYLQKHLKIQRQSKRHHPIQLQTFAATPFHIPIGVTP